MNTAASLLALRADPTALFLLADRRRSECFGASIAVESEAHATEHAYPWPGPEHWEDGARVYVRVEPEHAEAFTEWLLGLAKRDALQGTLIPHATAPSGIHRLWLIGVARLALPAGVHVAACHDRLGLRIAQVALRCGADCLWGALERERRLPLAGAPRPDEATRAGLEALIEHAGLRVRA